MIERTLPPSPKFPDTKPQYLPVTVSGRGSERERVVLVQPEAIHSYLIIDRDRPTGPGCPFASDPRGRISTFARRITDPLVLHAFTGGAVPLILGSEPRFFFFFLFFLHSHTTRYKANVPYPRSAFRWEPPPLDLTPSLCSASIQRLGAWVSWSDFGFSVPSVNVCGAVTTAREWIACILLVRWVEGT